MDETEKKAVRDAFKVANPDLNLKDEEISVGNDGKVTINQGGKTGEVPADKTVVEESKIIKLNKPTHVEVKDINNLTPTEKEKVKAAVKTANLTLRDSDIVVNDDGSVTVVLTIQR